MYHPAWILLLLLVAGPVQRGPAPEAPPEPAPGAPPGFEPRGFVRSPFVEIRGQVFVDRPRQLTDPIEIRLLEESGIIRDYAGAFGSGHFIFKEVPSTGKYYIDINVDGFEPVHYLVANTELAVGPFLTFILKSTEPIVSAVRVEKSDELPVVDLTQLQVEIPEEAQEAYDQASQMASLGDHEGAIAQLEKAVSLEPAYFEAQNNLGAQYLTLGRNADAEAALERARELNPNSAKPLLNLGVLYVQEGDRAGQAGDEDQAEERFVKAVEVLDEAILKDPLSAQTSYYLGTALYKTGQYEESEAVLYRALDLDPDFHQARIVLINVYNRLGQLDSALEQADAFIQGSPNSPQRVGVEQMKQRIQAALDR